MYKYSHTIFNELLQFVNKWNFDELLGQHQIDKRKKKFSTWNTFQCLFIAQVFWCDSIRHLWTVLECNQSKLYHLWIKSFARSTFSDWINKVPSSLFQQLFYRILSETTQLITQKQRSEAWNKVYAIDATIVSLVLSVFNWAYYRKKKWAIKLHTRLNLWTAIPDLVYLTDGKKTDWKTAHLLTDWLEKWSIVVFDRWYLDYEYWYQLTQQWVVFVTRTKHNTEYTPIDHFPIPHHCITYDARVEFVYWTSYEKYPKPIRVVRYRDQKTWDIYEYITNDFNLPALTIAQFYDQRRNIEQLFRRLKQNLQIKEYLWTSKNAVENQVRVALICYLIMVTIRIKTHCSEDLLTLRRKLWILLFERVSLISCLWTPLKILKNIASPPQLSLF